MSLACRNDFFPRMRAYHDELWAEHDRMMKRHFEIVEKMWQDIDREFFAERQRIHNSIQDNLNRANTHHFSTSSSSVTNNHHHSSSTTKTTTNPDNISNSINNNNNNNRVSVRANLELDVFPRVNNNQVSMKMQLPEKIDKSKLDVTNKDGDLIVRLEDKQDTPAGGSRSVCYFSQTTMPHNTDFTNLKWSLDDNNVLTVTAPLKQN